MNKLEFFIDKAKKVHGDKYDYSKVEYINNHTKICIICPVHGEFLQIPTNHLKGKGCFECNGIHKKDTEQFIKNARKIHGNKYDYSKVEYKNYETKVCIICPIHGEFWQTPDSHLQGKGCKYCNESKLETTIRFLLSNNNVCFEAQKRFEWLGKQSLDFYIPSKNIAIECQGIQHFEPNEHFGGEKDFKITIKRDKIKRNLCESHGIKLLYYSNLGIKYPYSVYENTEEILREIKNI